MPSLLELQRAVAREFDAPGETVASHWIVPDGIDAARRLGIHRNSGVSVLTTSLRLSYPAVRRLVGDAFFEGAVRRFIERHPPGGAWLDAYGAELGDFFAGFEPAASLPYLPDVARLEWAVNCALHAPDAPALDPTRLLELPGPDRGSVRFVPSPCAKLLRAGCPADLIWRAVLADDDAALAAVDPRQGPAWLLVERGESGSVDVRRLPEEEGSFTERLFRGCTLQAALEESDSRAAAWLAAHLACGRFTDFALPGASR